MFCFVLFCFVTALWCQVSYTEMKCVRVIKKKYLSQTVNVLIMTCVKKKKKEDREMNSKGGTEQEALLFYLFSM